MNHGLHQQPLGVDEKVTLPALDFFPASNRADRSRPPFPALLTLGLSMMRRLGWPHVRPARDIFVERVMDPIQHAINAPIEKHR